MYKNENWFVILLSRVYFGDLVTKIHYFSMLNGNISAPSIYVNCNFYEWKSIRNVLKWATGPIAVSIAPNYKITIAPNFS